MMKGGMRAMLTVVMAGVMFTAPAWGQHPDEMAVVTFNIRYDNPDDPLTWEERKDKVAGTVGYFDILGFQEALAHQVDDLAARLPNHEHYGVGRDDGRNAGEHCPIFWNRGRFDLLHAETIWLSETPDVPGSIGWDAVLPRTATLVLLHDRKTGKVIRVANAHFSHIGEESRALAARMLSLQFSMSTADVDILLGDLNAEAGSTALEILEGGGLSDAHDIASKRCRQNIGTYTGFATGGLRGAPRIDHILVRGATVPWYCTEEQIIGAYYISDHLPVYIALMP
jgi:endonuclease/exonuclease/phosphatase family metal-dependent hydrolase